MASECEIWSRATVIRHAIERAEVGAIGIWIEANHFEIAGPCREVFLESVIHPPGFEGALVEIQFPVRPAA